MDKEARGRSLKVANLTYYDILAMLCSKIHSLTEDIRNRLYEIVDSNLDAYILSAAKHFPCLALKGKMPLPKYHDVDESMASELLDFADSTEIEKLGIVLGSISLIDTAMDLGRNFKSFIEGKNCRGVSDGEYISDGFYAFDALNYNTRDDFGVVLPYLSCAWEKNSDRTLETVAFMPLALVLKNYIWVPNQSFWKINNLYTDMKRVGINAVLIPDTQPLKIVSSPVIKHSPFYANLNKDDRVFYIQYQDLYDDDILNRMKKVIEYSFREYADIVIFPEMMGREKCISLCKDYIGEDVSAKRPQLYIMPSREYCKDGQWYNTVDILDEEGECIFKYNKQHSFVYDHKERDMKKVSYKEPIVPDGNICVIHASGIGRIGLIVCSDIFKDGYLEWLIKNLKLTLLLYPVFSAGKDLLVRKLSIAHMLSCDVLMCNTCAAWEDFLIPPAERPSNEGFDSTFINVYYPYGHLPAGDTKQRILCGKKDCTGCVFVTSICKDYRCDACQIQQIGLEGE